MKGDVVKGDIVKGDIVKGDVVKGVGVMENEPVVDSSVMKKLFEMNNLNKFSLKNPLLWSLS